MAKALSSTFKAITERAINSPQTADPTDYSEAVDALNQLDGTPRYQGNRKLSPFGHNATATNGDIDFALCNGANILSEVIDKVSRFKKTRKAD